MIFAAFFSSPEAERQKGEKDEFCYAERTKKDGSCCRRRKTASFFEKILEEGTEVVLRKLMENHAEVVVYKNGYVSYQAHERSTVFPIHDCKHYHYESQGNEQQTIPHDHFEDMEWHIRLVIEGEDCLAHNTSSRESEVFSYSEDNDYNARLADPRMNVSDMVVNKVLLRSIKDFLRKEQWEHLCRHHIEDMTFQEIAEITGVTPQAVKKSLDRGLRRVRRKYSRYI